MAAESARNTGFEVQEYQVRVYFGNEHYWIEDQDTPIQYGEILSEILNFDAKPFDDAVAYWQKCEDESDWENLNAARDAVYGEFEKLPFYNRCSRKPVHEEVETIKIDPRYRGFEKMEAVCQRAQRLAVHSKPLCLVS